MRSPTKWLIGLAGILIILVGGLLLVTSIHLGAISDWTNDVLAYDTEISGLMLAIAGGFVMLVGLIILLISLFKPRIVSVIELQGARGSVRLPVTAIENDLKRRIEAGVEVGHIEVQIRAHAKHQQADVKVHGYALSHGTPQFDAMGETILQIVKQYLEESLQFKLRHRHVTIEAFGNMPQQARVV